MRSLLFIFLSNLPHISTTAERSWRYSSIDYDSPIHQHISDKLKQEVPTHDLFRIGGVLTLRCKPNENVWFRSGVEAKDIKVGNHLVSLKLTTNYIGALFCVTGTIRDATNVKLQDVPFLKIPYLVPEETDGCWSERQCETCRCTTMFKTIDQTLARIPCAQLQLSECLYSNQIVNNDSLRILNFADFVNKSSYQMDSMYIDHYDHVCLLYIYGLVHVNESIDQQIQYNVQDGHKLVLALVIEPSNSGSWVDLTHWKRVGPVEYAKLTQVAAVAYFMTVGERSWRYSSIDYDSPIHQHISDKLKQEVPTHDLFRIGGVLKLRCKPNENVWFRSGVKAKDLKVGNYLVRLKLTTNYIGALFCVRDTIRDATNVKLQDVPFLKIPYLVPEETDGCWSERQCETCRCTTMFKTIDQTLARIPCAQLQLSECLYSNQIVNNDSLRILNFADFVNKSSYQMDSMYIDHYDHVCLLYIYGLAHVNVSIDQQIQSNVHDGHKLDLALVIEPSNSGSWVDLTHWKRVGPVEYKKLTQIAAVAYFLTLGVNTSISCIQTDLSNSAHSVGFTKNTVDTNTNRIINFTINAIPQLLTSGMTRTFCVTGKQRKYVIFYLAFYPIDMKHGSKWRQLGTKVPDKVVTQSTTEDESICTHIQQSTMKYTVISTNDSIDLLRSNRQKFSIVVDVCIDTNQKDLMLRNVTAAPNTFQVSTSKQTTVDLQLMFIYNDTELEHYTDLCDRSANFNPTSIESACFVSGQRFVAYRINVQCEHNVHVIGNPKRPCERSDNHYYTIYGVLSIPILFPRVMTPYETVRLFADDQLVSHGHLLTTKINSIKLKYRGSGIILSETECFGFAIDDVHLHVRFSLTEETQITVDLPNGDYTAFGHVWEFQCFFKAKASCVTRKPNSTISKETYISIVFYVSNPSMIRRSMEKQRSSCEDPGQEMMQFGSQSAAWIRSKDQCFLVVFHQVTLPFHVGRIVVDDIFAKKLASMPTTSATSSPDQSSDQTNYTVSAILLVLLSLVLVILFAFCIIYYKHHLLTESIHESQERLLKEALEQFENMKSFHKPISRWVIEQLKSDDQNLLNAPAILKIVRQPLTSVIFASRVPKLKLPRTCVASLPNSKYPEIPLFSHNSITAIFKDAQNLHISVLKDVSKKLVYAAMSPARVEMDHYLDFIGTINMPILVILDGFSKHSTEKSDGAMKSRITRPRIRKNSSTSWLNEKQFIHWSVRKVHDKTTKYGKHLQMNMTKITKDHAEVRQGKTDVRTNGIGKGLQIFQIKSWDEPFAPPIRDLVDVIHIVRNLKTSGETIVVQCEDGVKKTMIFMAAMLAVEMLEEFKVVNIIELIQYLRQMRYGCFPHKSRRQFVLCTMKIIDQYIRTYLGDLLRSTSRASR